MNRLILVLCVAWITTVNATSAVDMSDKTKVEKIGNKTQKKIQIGFDVGMGVNYNSYKFSSSKDKIFEVIDNSACTPT